MFILCYDLWGSCVWVYGLNNWSGWFMLMWVFWRRVLLLGYSHSLGCLKIKKKIKNFLGLFGNCGLRILDWRVTEDCWRGYWWVYVFCVSDDFGSPTVLICCALGIEPAFFKFNNSVSHCKITSSLKFEISFAS